MLNVYKMSGLPKVGAVNTYRVWMAQTKDFTNTRSYNWLLSDINECMMLIGIGGGGQDITALYNQVDLDIICLEALDANKDNPEQYTLDFVGSIMAEMFEDGKFHNDSTDEEIRSDNLDILIGDFKARLSETLTGNANESILQWWNDNIVPNNYNESTPEQIKRYDDIFTPGDKIGKDLKNPSDYDNMTDYIVDSGPCFLYLFIPENEKEQYNRIINWKRDGEDSVTFDYIVTNVGGVYDESSILKLLRIGCIKYWGMTPEEKLKQIRESGGGKIGIAVEAIISIIASIVAILATLLSMILTIYQLTYSVSDNANQYVPDDNDLVGTFEAGAEEKKSSLLSTENTKKWLPIVAIGAAALLLFNS